MAFSYTPYTSSDNPTKHHYTRLKTQSERISVGVFFCAAAFSACENLFQKNFSFPQIFLEKTLDKGIRSWYYDLANRDIVFPVKAAENNPARVFW